MMAKICQVPHPSLNPRPYTLINEQFKPAALNVKSQLKGEGGRVKLEG